MIEILFYLVRTLTASLEFLSEINKFRNAINGVFFNTFCKRARLVVRVTTYGLRDSRFMQRLDFCIHFRTSLNFAMIFSQLLNFFRFFTVFIYSRFFYCKLVLY